MKRFNQYMNGEREFKLENHNIKVLDDEQTTVKAVYEALYKDEIKSLKDAVEDSFDRLCSFNINFTEAISEKIKKDIKVKAITTDVEDEFPVFDVNVLKLIEKQFPNYEYSDKFVLLTYLRNNLTFRENFEIIEGALYDSEIQVKPKENKDNFIIRKKLKDLDEQHFNSPNKYDEIRYYETGEEEEISLQAAESRDYEEYFKEF